MKKQREFEADPTRQDSREWVQSMTKQHISMKYLFIIGFHEDFDNDTFRDFLKFLMDLPSGKPFQLFLYKYNQEILQIEFPYLYLEGDKKKALSLYPNILLKCIDLGLSDQKQKFQVCMGDNFKIQLDQIEALGIHSIIIIDDTSSSPELQQKFQKYKKDNLRVLQQSMLDKDYLKLYDTPEGFDGAFKKLAD
jgi:hypothetical protein